MSTTDDPRAPALAYFAAVRKAYIDALRQALEEHTASVAARGGQVLIEAKVKDHVAPEHDVPWEAAPYQFGSDFLVLVKDFVWHRCAILTTPVPAHSACTTSADRSCRGQVTSSA
jgi:hypothetical protein